MYADTILGHIRILTQITVRISVTRKERRMIEMTTVDKEGRAKIEPVILVPKDYVQVVRCKNCKRRNKYMICPVWGQKLSDYDYCSYGERRDESEVKE